MAHTHLATFALLIVLSCLAATPAIASPGQPQDQDTEDPDAPPAVTWADEMEEAAREDPDASLSGYHPWSFSLQTGAGIGLLFTHFGRTTISLERRFADRVTLEACLRLGYAEGLTMVEPGMRLGVLLHLAASWDLLLGWRLTYSGFQMDNHLYQGWAHAVGTGPMLEARYAISPRWELRLLSLELSAYWSGYWSFALEPVVGMGVRF